MPKRGADAVRRPFHRFHMRCLVAAIARPVPGIGSIVGLAGSLPPLAGRKARQGLVFGTMNT